MVARLLESGKIRIDTQGDQALADELAKFDWRTVCGNESEK
jgi:hypothetical protein